MKLSSEQQNCIKALTKVTSNPDFGDATKAAAERLIEVYREKQALCETTEETLNGEIKE